MAAGGGGDTAMDAVESVGGVKRGVAEVTREEETSKDADAVFVHVAFRKETADLRLPGDATVYTLKRAIEDTFRVPAERQKLPGVKIPRGVEDADARLVDVKLPRKLILMGSRDEDLLRPLSDEDEARLDALEKEMEREDAEMELAGDGGALSAPHKNPTLLARVEERVGRVDVLMGEGFRADVKNTLVLDIDYTLFDHRSVVSHPLQQKRPFLDEFLAAVYPYYNIVIWSATGLKWITTKLREVGVYSPDRKAPVAPGTPGELPFGFACLVDKNAMITVESAKYGVVNCKPLGYLWGKFPDHCNPERTIMFDDIRRNFLMNPKHGLRIKPCRDLLHTRDTDTELRDLTAYLLAIRDMASFSTLRHRKWKDFVRSIISAPEDVLREAGLDPAVVANAQSVWRSLHRPSGSD